MRELEGGWKAALAKRACGHNAGRASPRTTPLPASGSLLGLPSVPLCGLTLGPLHACPHTESSGRHELHSHARVTPTTNPSKFVFFPRPSEGVKPACVSIKRIFPHGVDPQDVRPWRGQLPSGSLLCTRPGAGKVPEETGEPACVPGRRTHHGHGKGTRARGPPHSGGCQCLRNRNATGVGTMTRICRATPKGRGQDVGRNPGSASHGCVAPDGGPASASGWECGRRGRGRTGAWG